MMNHENFIRHLHTHRRDPVGGRKAHERMRIEDGWDKGCWVNRGKGSPLGQWSRLGLRTGGSERCGGINPGKSMAESADSLGEIIPRGRGHPDYPR